MSVRRLFVEKKQGYNIEAEALRRDLTQNLGVRGIEKLRILHRYDTESITAEDHARAKLMVYSEPPIDDVYEDTFPLSQDEAVITTAYLPGQYDQRADSAAQCIQLITLGDRPLVRVARVLVFRGELTQRDLDKIRKHVINPVEMQEVSTDMPQTLSTGYSAPADVVTMHGFCNWDKQSLSNVMNEMGFAMTLEDLIFCQSYFKGSEKRDPSITELRMIDTYWSDHCRHTTFLAAIDEPSFSSGPICQKIKEAWELYIKTRAAVYKEKEKDICLMDIATLAMKDLRRRGMLEDLDLSDEINACSIIVRADVGGRTEDWLVMFKNETHNHPTEIEPFGGAATCLGGAIRDPLSGRSYVYQAMRVTGSGDPTAAFSATISGKLPQRVITTTAAHGYSSYGNQIGLATGQVAEIYHEGYVAKRMEVGVVVGAAPRVNVVRQAPSPGDIIILLGGRTGRDGCGGATGSSKAHNADSLASCGAEVQKGNPPTERKIQRLFRDQGVTRLIKRCNDFGAGGVSVAIGELSDGVDINLDAIPKKYDGLDGTELAISESQERMAVVVAPEHAARFIEAARKENLEAVKVAVVTSEGRLRMRWRGKTIVDLSREFLDTNGARQQASVEVAEPDTRHSPFDAIPTAEIFGSKDLQAAWHANLEDLNVCSKKGLGERFDSTIGSATVLMPYGGLYQLTPAEGMAAKLPVQSGNTNTGTVMTFGFNPLISSWSPFHGAIYAVVESLAKLVACGASYKEARLTFQEYFERLEKNPIRWGKPFAALLGAFWTQMELGIPAIGGKDSMSGTFNDLHVPPTLISFAISAFDIRKIISSEFKKAGSTVIAVILKKDGLQLPLASSIAETYTCVHMAMTKGKVLSASTVKRGGIAAAASQMAFGNGIGIRFVGNFSKTRLFCIEPGALILELEGGCLPDELFGKLQFLVLGETTSEPEIAINGIKMPVSELEAKWSGRLKEIFPSAGDTKYEDEAVKKIVWEKKSRSTRSIPAIARPRAFIPVFPGTNCEYDTARALGEAGAFADIFVMNNLSPREIDASVHEMEKRIRNSQMIVLPGGFSAGDEPDGSGKFIATVFRSPWLEEAVMELLRNRDGLILGICNGFQALVKLGLLPYGNIRPLTSECPTLTFNRIGRHVSGIVRTRKASNLSPWLLKEDLGSILSVPVSHGEGRFVASETMLSQLEACGQIATQYVDLEGRPTMDEKFNPNGSMWAIEGITSPDGRILGRMGHSERYTEGTYKNVPGDYKTRLFEGGVEWFK